MSEWSNIVSTVHYVNQQAQMIAGMFNHFFGGLMIPIFHSKVLTTLPSILGSSIAKFSIEKNPNWLQILLAIKSHRQLLVEASTLNFPLVLLNHHDYKIIFFLRNYI